MIKVGQKVEINPFKDIRAAAGLGPINETVEGIVHFVHPTNRWFNVKYGSEGGERLIGYKFDDIDKTVKLIGG